MSNLTVYNGPEVSFPLEFAPKPPSPAFAENSWAQYTVELANPATRKALIAWADTYPILVRSNERLVYLAREAYRLDLADRIAVPILGSIASYLPNVIYQITGVTYWVYDWANRTQADIVRAEIALFACGAITAQEMHVGLAAKHVNMFDMSGEDDLYRTTTIPALRTLPSEKVVKVLQARPEFFGTFDCVLYALPLLKEFNSDQLMAVFALTKERGPSWSPLENLEVFKVAWLLLAEKLGAELFIDLLLQGGGDSEPILFSAGILEHTIPFLLGKRKQKALRLQSGQIVKILQKPNTFFTTVERTRQAVPLLQVLDATQAQAVFFPTNDGDWVSLLQDVAVLSFLWDWLLAKLGNGGMSGLLLQVVSTEYPTPLLFCEGVFERAFLWIQSLNGDLIMILFEKQDRVEGNTLLHLSGMMDNFFSQDYSVIREKLGRERIDRLFAIRNFAGCTPVYGHLEAVIDWYDTPLFMPFALEKNRHGQTSLYLALAKGFEEIFTRLVAKVGDQVVELLLFESPPKHLVHMSVCDEMGLKKMSETLTLPQLMTILSTQDRTGKTPLYWVLEKTKWTHQQRLFKALEAKIGRANIYTLLNMKCVDDKNHWQALKIERRANGSIAPIGVYSLSDY